MKDIIQTLFKQFPITCIYSSCRIDCRRGAPGCMENRKKICISAEIDYGNLVFPEQKHGAKVYTATANDKGSIIPGCDALITRQKNLPLAVLSADCLTIFLYDPEIKAIGIGHAGWQGTRSGIARKLVRSMSREFGSTPYNIHAEFGPSIRQCCYEVEKSFLEYFPHSISTKGGKYFFDLVGENKRQLIKSGVTPSRISDSGICTSCSAERFFSYRREGEKAGRMISIIEIRK